MKNGVRPCYNNYVMDRNTPNMWYLRIALGLVLLAGLLPISHVLSMQSGPMQMPSQAGALNGDLSTGQNLPTSCCNDTFGSFVTMCGFAILPSACATHSVGTDRVAFSTFSIEPGNREIVTPPPKI